jgi:hypothetical protein
MSYKRSQVRKENFNKRKGSVDRTLDRHQKHDYKIRKEQLEVEQNGFTNVRSRYSTQEC